MRTHYCGELNKSHENEEVILCGWAHRRRDHGGVIFIDLRDREGLAQIVIDPDTPDAFKIAETIRNEFVLKVTCKVRLRPEGTINLNLPSGEIEIPAAIAGPILDAIVGSVKELENQIKENIDNAGTSDANTDKKKTKGK